MQTNDPDVIAEVASAFKEYETALVGNDLETLNRLFLDSPHTIRYGASENLYGYAEIADFRANRPSDKLARKLERTVITAYGENFAVTATLFRREHSPNLVGRQMQTWVRTEKGWRIVAAHVSLVNEQTK